MGAFFTNCQVRSDDANAVATALTPLLQSRAYVSPASGGWVTVYDEATESQDSKLLIHLAKELSKALNTTACGFLVHDSDIAVYHLCQNGELVDEFDSCPDYYNKKVNAKERQRVRGVTDKLLPLCVTGTTREQIDAIIHPASGEDFPTFAEEILRELGILLGMDENRVSLGFKYFEDEGEDMVEDAGEFTLVDKKWKPTTPKPTKPHAEKAKTAKPPTEQMDMAWFGLSMAVGMLTKRWTDEASTRAAAFSKMLPDTQVSDLEKKLSSGFDKAGRDFYKRMPFAGGPTFEELKAARDAGPDAFAALLVKRTPTVLGCFATDAIREKMEAFVAALLKHGLDPHTLNQHGQDIMSIAEKAGTDSAIYKMLKEAAGKRG